MLEHKALEINNYICSKNRNKSLFRRGYFLTIVRGKSGENTFPFIMLQSGLMKGSVAYCVHVFFTNCDCGAVSICSIFAPFAGLYGVL